MNSLRLMCLLIALTATGLAQPQAHWPGWRGDGSGVSQETGLPEKWGPQENVLWKTRIEGDGISAPIIWDDKVFVTTAVEGTEAAVSGLLISISLAVLALLALGVLTRSFLKRQGPERPSDDPKGPWWVRLALAADGLGALLAFGLFLYAIALPLFGQGLPQSGDLAGIWLRSGKVALVGLVATVGALSVGSKWRVVGALAMLLFAGLFYSQAPRDMWTNPLPAATLARIAGPIALAAAWYLALFVALRRYSGSSRPFRPVGFFSAAVLAMTVLSFAHQNYLQPRAGLWRSIVCLDKDTGEVLWQRPGFLAEAGRKYVSNSYATPTPVTDGESMVAYFGPGLVSMDMEGRVQWLKTEPKYQQYLRYGAANSPVMFEDSIIYAYMAENPVSGEGKGFTHSKHSYLTALSKKTGEELWRTDSIPGAHDSYGTPLVVRPKDGDALLLFSTYHHALAFDPGTGRQLWHCELPLEQPVPSFVADEETAYVSGGIHGPGGVAAIRLGGSGNVTETHMKWRISSGMPEVASPVLYRGLLYWVTEGGVVYCVDPETGERVWRARAPRAPRYMGSLVAGDGKVYLPAVDGKVAVIKAGREFELLAENEIGEESYSTPALASGRIFIRGKEHLFCIGTESEGMATTRR